MWSETDIIRLSDAYKAVERDRKRNNYEPLSESSLTWKKYQELMEKFESENPVPLECWYGMKSRDGYPADKDSVWIPWLCGSIENLPIPIGIKKLWAWTESIGNWRVIDLYEDCGPEYINRAILCWIRTGHNFSDHICRPGSMNSPFGEDVAYSHCDDCPACLNRGPWQKLPNFHQLNSERARDDIREDAGTGERKQNNTLLRKVGQRLGLWA